MATGLSLFLVAAGAILAPGVNYQTSGIEVQTIGIILLVVGIVGLAFSMLFLASIAPFSDRSPRDVHTHDHL